MTEIRPNMAQQSRRILNTMLAPNGAIDSRFMSDFHILKLDALHHGKLDESFESRADPCTAYGIGWETASRSNSKFRQSSDSECANSRGVSTWDYNTGFSYVDANL